MSKSEKKRIIESDHIQKDTKRKLEDVHFPLNLFRSKNKSTRARNFGDVASDA